MHLEVRRQAFHLAFGCLLACLVLGLKEELSILVFGSCLVIGIFISELIRRKIKIPVFSWFIKKFERKKVRPGKGVIHFFLGVFIALIFFNSFIVFLSILILAFGDAFSTIFGKAFGRTKIYKKKTLEGFSAGFVASFFVCIAYVPVLPAFLACLTASFIEVFSPIDDNIVIPPIASLIIYFLKAY